MLFNYLKSTKEFNLDLLMHSRGTCNSEMLNVLKNKRKPDFANNSASENGVQGSKLTVTILLLLTISSLEFVLYRDNCFFYTNWFGQCPHLNWQISV